MSLAYPEKWAGPYLKENPSLEGIFYEFIKAHDGYFIVPGRGVTLPNGCVMGKDFIVNATTDVMPQLVQSGKLFYKGIMYGVHIQFKIGDWDSVLKSSEIKEKKVSKMLDEFNDALPFAHNASSTLNA
jgi:hypothetical protein